VSKKFKNIDKFTKDPVANTPINKRIFVIIFMVFSTGYLALSFPARIFSPLQFLRQPMLIVGIVALIWSYHSRRKWQSNQRFMMILISVFIAYLLFNIYLGLSLSNSIFYSIWLLASWFFMYQFAASQHQIGATTVIKSGMLALFLVLLIINLVSYIGGYVLGLPNFFDERYNYTAGMLKMEFGGVFGSNNAIGLIGFITLSVWLLYANLKKWNGKWFFWPLNVVWLINLFHIGNRSSMLCGALLIIGFTVFVHRQLLVIVLLFLGAGYFTASNTEYIAEKLRFDQFEGDNVLGNRGELIEEGLHVIDELHVFGAGYANQRLARFKYLNISEDDKQLNFHNSYIALAVELGYGGAFIFLCIVILPLVVSIFQSWPPHLHSSLMLTSLILSIIIFAYMPFEDSINSPGSPSFGFFWMLWFWQVITIDQYASTSTSHAKAA
jgi:hypothetical protein